MKVKAGETELTLQPGKTVDVKLAVGTKVVADDQTQHYQPGDVLAVASQDLRDSTIILH